jgi:demethylmenaquinone methyltransferase/2-methoxy-6-polyprenyl-1,4-benzoquinol methylase
MMKEKSRSIRIMFGGIAGKYDLMNRLMTFGQDQVWRRWVVRMANPPLGGRLLDAGTGTGRIGQEVLKSYPATRVTGSDFSLEMMQAGKRRHAGGGMFWCAGDALCLPFKDESFDVVTSGYLIRNVEDAGMAFSEQVRVLKTGGRVVCLDTSPPPNTLLKPFIVFFLTHIIPLLGQIISRNRSAYTYLPESTQTFYTPDALATVMQRAGLTNIFHRSFMLGTIAIHVGTKPET